MNILIGSLANPIRFLKRSPHLVLEGRLVSASVPFQPVVAKLLPDPGFAIELVCGWLANAVGLPMPQVGVATANASLVSKHGTWPYEDLTAKVFVCALIPNAQRVVSVDSPVIDERLDEWQFAELAGVFDELVSNDDRSKGNLLLDARGNFWLIDHARALGGAGQRLFSTEVFPAFENYFLGRIARERTDKRYSRKQALLRCCAHVRNHVARIPYSDLGVSFVLETDIRNYLAARLRKLEELVLNRVGIQDLTINAQEQPKAH
jgi:hypothetical protein